MRVRLLAQYASRARCVACTKRHFTDVSAALSDELLQLYGRPPENAKSQTHTAPVNHEQKTVIYPEGVVRAPWLSALTEFNADSYAHPNRVSTELCRRTLHALRAVYENPATRYLRSAGRLWSNALTVLRHLTAPSLSDVWQVGISLYYAEQYETARGVVEKALDSAGENPHSDVQAIIYELQLLSLHTMCCVQLAMKQARRWQDHSCAALQRARGIVAQDPQARHQTMTHASYLLCYSYDWAYCFTPCVLGGDDVESTITRLQTLMPPQLSSLCFTQSGDVAKPLTLSELRDEGTTPAQFYRAAEQANAKCDGVMLRRLYTTAVRRERVYSPFGVFKLSVDLGSAVLRCSAGSLALQTRIVQRIGTSLDPSVLPCYSHRGGAHAREQAVAVLASRVAGVASYAALQRILDHSSSAIASRVQERYGDLLTGKTTATWRAALAQMDRSLALADGAWRSDLPTTLRLLSDGGRWATCLRLLAEYDMSRGTEQLCVAYALGRALRQSGRWWHAMEVVDLIAAAQTAPQCAADDYFLEQACRHTLRSLQNAERWAEASTLHQMLAPAMQVQSWSMPGPVAHSTPPDMPWQKATQHTRSPENVPFAFLHTRHCDDELAGMAGRPPSCPTRHLLLAPRHGTLNNRDIVLVTEEWCKFLRDRAASLSRVCPSVQGANGDDDKNTAKSLAAWMNVLRALLHTFVNSETTERVLCDMSPSLLQHDALLRLTFRVSCAYGWLAKFAEMLQCGSTTATPLALQYKSLVTFMLYGTPPQRDTLFDDSLVIHGFHSLVVRDNLTLYLAPQLVAQHGTKESLATWLRVPAMCVALPRMTRVARDSYARKVVTAEGPPREDIRGCCLYPVPALTVPPRHVIHHTADKSVVVGYKPATAPLSSVARGVVRLVSTTTSSYNLLYHIPPQSSGLFVLYRASMAGRSLTATLALGFYLSPLSSTRSALLSARFFSTYAMRVVCGPRGDGRVGVHATCPFALANGTIDHTLHQLLADVRADGWGVVAGGEEDCDGGFHIHMIYLCIREGNDQYIERVHLRSTETSTRAMKALYS